MNLKYPRKASLGWVSKIRNLHIGIVLLQLLGYYLAINILFSIAYYFFEVLKNKTVFFDYVYFSFITSLAIGYGDFVPVTKIGKVIVIIHSSITAMYFALMISVLSIKMLYPRNLIKFSEKIIYNPTTDMLIFRVINTNKEPLVNPDLRISVTEHNAWDRSAGVFNILTDYYITYLGKHDFSYTFKNTFQNFNVIEESNKAKEYNKQINSLESRFRINLSITGSYGYGMQQIAICKKYFADDIIIGKSFKPIIYNKEVYTKKEIKYNKIKNFWEDFESIEK
ncbi:MAG: potassium channel family protein [Sedimentibacter sp.]|uniref:potassium channel family protein n=1 Tax=Sedimentibacter sp. TaxID=1960295 RepID=UPI0029813533|nr:potassium channel family protein [Sedimentibacter sp.]MDW5300640.1 potassium channel family protein [Sedimentibacter sp.]